MNLETMQTRPLQLPTNAFAFAVYVIPQVTLGVRVYSIPHIPLGVQIWGETTILWYLVDQYFILY